MRRKRSERHKEREREREQDGVEHLSESLLSSVQVAPEIGSVHDGFQVVHGNHT